MDQQASPDDVVSGFGGQNLGQSSSQGTHQSYAFRADDLSFGTKRRRKTVEGMEDDDEEDDDASERKKNPGRRKIDIEYIQDKSKRHITFSKRKAGIMKKAYELATLTGTQLLLLVVSETGIVYTFTTPKLQPIVSVDPGKSLISSCLNDGEAEIQIEQEEPDETLIEDSQMNPAEALEENDYLNISSAQPSTSTEVVNLPQQTSSEVYHSESQQNTLPSSFPPTNSLTYFPESTQQLMPPYESMLLNPSGFQNMYDNLGQQIGLPTESSFGAVPNGLQLRPGCNASFLDIAQPQEISPIGGFMPPESLTDNRRVKRRRTETDLRGRHECQSSVSPFFSNQFPFETPQGWIENEELMKLGTIHGNTPASFETLNRVVDNFIAQERGQIPGAMPLELGQSTFHSQLEKNVSLFLDACDHYPPGDTYSGNKRWREKLFPTKDLLSGCLKFFFEEYLPLNSFSLETFMKCCEDLRKLVLYLCVLYEQPEHASAELAEVIQNASSPFLKASSQASLPSTSNQSILPLSAAYSQKLKTAPKLKPRKGVNVNLRGLRLRTTLEEYAAWCRKNKSSWSGNKPNSRLQGWFKVERVRKTFCCCSFGGKPSDEVVSSVLKIRFPSAAIKVIRKGDKLELEVEQSDDGREWNIFNHTDSELYPGDESEEEESSYILPDRLMETSNLEALCEEKGMSIEEAKVYVENRRLMKLQIEGGDFEDDGFESKVPPKGGKQAFRIKPVGPASKGTTSEPQQFDGEDIGNGRRINSPH